MSKNKNKKIAAAVASPPAKKEKVKEFKSYRQKLQDGDLTRELTEHELRNHELQVKALEEKHS